MSGVILGVAAILASLIFFAKKAQGETGTQFIDFKTPPAGYMTIPQMISMAATRYRVDAALVKAVAMTESSMNPNAANPSDPSYGLMQIMPILAEDFGIVKDWHNPTDAEIAMIKEPQTNLNIGTWHLSRLLLRYSLDVAIQMYNVGESGFNQGRRNADYLAKVKRYYDEYRNNPIG
jgi:soluble lytic murein transglycosylase-like protein